MAAPSDAVLIGNGRPGQTVSRGYFEGVRAQDNAENRRLRDFMGTLKDMVFGSRSEKLCAVVADQLALELADLATDVTLPAAANDDRVPSKPAGAASKPRKKAQRNIGALPEHLSRCEQVVDPETTACPCCQSRLHKIRQDVSEVLDVIPALPRVLRMIRPKYACRACEGAVVQAKAFPRLIENSMASTALTALTLRFLRIEANTIFTRAPRNFSEIARPSLEDLERHMAATVSQCRGFDGLPREDAWNCTREKGNRSQCRMQFTR